MAHEFNTVDQTLRDKPGEPHAQQVTPAVGNPCRYDPQTGVWSLLDGRTVPYPNDAFAASRLTGVLQSATDLSSLSPELEAAAGSWPASYYLSARRTSLLRGFSWDADADVLEVGAGCGTISRYLGETFRSVLAVEGESHRALLARMRTRDLQNVNVLNAPYEDLTFGRRFDLVFCIGVLEYASAFFGVQDAAHTMLVGMREVLNEDGALVLAIENQLGLKYFAGSAEDHTGLPFDGIEGYARSRGRGIETFNRRRLAQMLERAGFETVDFFYPFPDYKFPRCVIDEQAALLDSPALAGLIAHEPATDYLMPPSPHSFSQRLAWREAISAGLLGDLANSFLVMATPSSRRSPRWSAPWSAVSISVGRRLPAYWSETQIRELGTGHATVDRRQLIDVEPGDPRVSVELPYREAWHEAPTLGAQLERAMQDATCGTHELAELLGPWKLFLDSAIDARGYTDGQLFDALPQNMVDVNGQLHMFDRELRARARVAQKTIVIRGLRLMLVAAAQTPGAIPRLRHRSYWSVIREIADQLGLQLNTVDLCRAALFELNIQRATTGNGLSILLWPIDLRLRRIRSVRRRQQARLLIHRIYRALTSRPRAPRNRAPN